MSMCYMPKTKIIFVKHDNAEFYIIALRQRIFTDHVKEKKNGKNYFCIRKWDG